MFKNIKTADDLRAEELERDIQRFRVEREALVARNIVTVTSGKRFHADEPSIIKLGNSVIRHIDAPDDAIIKWSTADVGTGVMVECTKAEIVEAHKLAVEYVENIWSISRS